VPYGLTQSVVVLQSFTLVEVDCHSHTFAVIGWSLNRCHHSTSTTLVSMPKLLYSCHSVPLHLSCQSTLCATGTYSVNLLPVAIAVSHVMTRFLRNYSNLKNKAFPLFPIAESKKGLGNDIGVK